VWRKTVLWNPNVLLFNTKLRLSQKCTGIKLGFVSWHISENQIAITKILYFWSALTASLVLLYSISLSLSLPLSLYLSCIVSLSFEQGNMSMYLYEEAWVQIWRRKGSTSNCCGFNFNCTVLLLLRSGWYCIFTK